MKKTIFVILSIFLIIIICLYMNYKNMMVSQVQAKKFNQEYEFYSNQETILGTDITTLINKAIDNNEKYNIKKDKNGMYIVDEKNSMKIYVYMIINETTYPMEHLVATGLSDFTRYFGEVEFKCTDVKYHNETGKIAEMTFAATHE